MPEPLAPEELLVVANARAFIGAHQPDFLEYVEQSRHEEAAVVLAIDGFAHGDTRAQVQACLWYALGAGVPVTVRREKAPPI